MHTNIYRVRHCFERLPRVAWLTTTRTATRRAETTGWRSLQPVTRWRLATVSTVLRHLLFKRLDSCFQLPDGDPQFIDKYYHRLFSLSVRCVYLESTLLYLVTFLYWS